MHFNFVFKKIYDNVDMLLIVGLILLIPFTHKESFSVIDPDLVWSKFVLVICGIRGFYLFVKNFKALLLDRIFLVMLLFLVLQYLTLIYTQDFLSSVKYLGFFSCVVFSYPVVKSFLVKTGFNISTIVYTYAVSFLIVLGFLSVQIYLQENFSKAIGGVWPVPGYPSRYGATFWDVNHFGVYLASLFFLFFGFLFTSIKKNIEQYSSYNYIRDYLLKLLFRSNGFGDVLKSAQDKMIPLRLTLINIVLAVLVCTIPYVLDLTGSRSSAIGFAVSILLFCVIFANRNRNILNFFRNSYVWFFSGLSVFVLYTLSFYLFESGLRASFLYRSVSFYSHLFLLKVGIVSGLQNPMGVGVNAFSTYFQSSDWADTYYYIDKSALSLKLPLHNLWLEVWVETGVISFIVFATLWILILVGLFKVFKKNKDLVALSLMSVLTVFGVGGLFYSYKSEFFWFLFLLSAAYSSRKVGLAQAVTFHFNKLKLLRICSYLLSLCVFLLPFGFFTQPITHFELDRYSLQNLNSSNWIENFYYYLLNLTRYIIGNYSFTGRFLNLILYVSSFGIMVASWRIIKLHLINSILLTLNILMLISIAFVPFGIVSLLGIYLLIFSLVLFAVMIFLKEYVHFRNGITFYFLLTCLVLLTPFYFYKTLTFSKDSYPYYLTFMLELAANKGKTNDATIFLQEQEWTVLADYFTSSVETSDDGSFYLDQNIIQSSSNICNFSGSAYDVGYKFIILAKSGDTCPFVTREISNLSKIEQGGYVLYVFENRPHKMVAK